MLGVMSDLERLENDVTCYCSAWTPLQGVLSLNSAMFAGPGKAWSALEQGEYLFQLAERKPSFIKVPVALMDGIIGFLDFLTRILPGLEVRLCFWQCSTSLTRLSTKIPCDIAMRIAKSGSSLSAENVEF